MIPPLKIRPIAPQGLAFRVRAPTQLSLGTSLALKPYGPRTRNTLLETCPLRFALLVGVTTTYRTPNLTIGLSTRSDWTSWSKPCRLSYAWCSLSSVPGTAPRAKWWRISCGIALIPVGWLYFERLKQHLRCICEWENLARFSLGEERRKKKEEAKNGNESLAELAPKIKVNGIFRGVFEMTEES